MAYVSAANGTTTPRRSGVSQVLQGAERRSSQGSSSSPVGVLLLRWQQVLTLHLATDFRLLTL